jgi:hypothetical protein
MSSFFRTFGIAFAVSGAAAIGVALVLYPLLAKYQNEVPIAQDRPEDTERACRGVSFQQDQKIPKSCLETGQLIVSLENYGLRGNPRQSYAWFLIGQTAVHVRCLQIFGCSVEEVRQMNGRQNEQP